MKQFSYGERDYAFGQRMLTLRTTIGLTQAGLADRFGVSRRAVGEWEAGSAYPKAEHLKALLALCVWQQVFPAGREEEEIRALWKTAHQKVLLDEAWLSALLGQPSAPPTPVSVEESGGAEVGSAPPSPSDLLLASPPGQRPPSLGPLASSAPAASGPRLDWGEALDVPSFYGRQGELATLAQWMVQDRCRVVSVLGMGGIGKSALVTSAMRQLASHFQVVLFRSLRDAPSCEALLEDCLQRLAPQPLNLDTADLERRLSLLLEYLGEQRVLLVLDNLEALLLEGEVRGHLRPGYEGYSRLLQRVAERAHQSCVLLTSREKLAELRALEGRKMTVRSLRLAGLETSACEQLLVRHELLGSPQERARLIALYEGNPLALNIVAETISDLFGGQIAQFLAQQTLVFGNISDLLDEQVGRLSALEQTLLFWLAILREPVTLQELQAGLVAALAPGQLLEAVDGLRRRSLIEQGQRAGSFTLQSVVLEYVTDRLVRTASQEIVQGRLSLLREHGLSQAHAREYVRQTQERLLLVPVLASLQRAGQSRAQLEGQLRELLDGLRGRAQDYGPANLVALLRLLRGNLRGLNLSHLSLRGLSLQGIELQDANLSFALLRECLLTESFDAITTVATSLSGQYWAAAGLRGEVRVWREEGQTLHRVWQTHTGPIWNLAFSPEERLLASGSFDGSVKLWDVESGALLWSGWHTGAVVCLVFATDGQQIASCGDDATIRLWDLQSGRQLQTLPHPNPVLSLAWSPDGRRLATGSSDGQIRFWEIGHSGPATCVQTLTGHSNRVLGLAFAPDGSTLASASWDGTVKLWDAESGGVRQTLTGHIDRVNRVVWSPDGRTLTSGGRDTTIWLWDTQQGSYRAALQGHSASVNSLSFTPDGRSLLSGSDDGTMRLWNVESGQCMRVIRGYAASLFDVDWSPDGTQLASAGSDTVVTIWNVARQAEEGRRAAEGGGTPTRVFSRHRGVVYAVAWSPDGRFLASSAWDDVISLWDVTTGTRAVLRDPDNSDTILRGVAWSPDGRFLASGTSLYGVQVWEMTTRSRRWAGHQLSTWIRHLAWSPDGTWLVGGGDDGQLYVWDASDGTLLQQLTAHQGVVTSVAWSPDGKWLVSAGRSRGSGELVVWDAQSWQPVRAFAQQGGVIYAVAWSASGERLVSGGSDGRLRWWQVQSGECFQVHQAHTGTIRSLRSSPDASRLASCGDDGAITLWDLESGKHVQTLRRDRPYERLDISGIRGLTEAQKATLRGLGATEDPLPTTRQAP
jgi:WD40 repeat protein/transcriptional regulator with XRE-family HTH domain